MESVQGTGMPWWAWLLIIVAVIFLAWLIWRYLTRRRAPVASEARPVGGQATMPEPAAVLDDLKRIEGIGPKVASLLASQGILTFAQLAATDVASIREVLDRAQLQMIDPSSWAEQAALAAGGQWDDLAALQDELKGGRRA